MAIIVKHKKTGEEYVLLGTGYGAFKASRPGLIGGSLFPEEEEGTYHMLAVSDFTGNIHWFEDEAFQVTEVDGIKLKELKPNRLKKKR